MPSRSGDRTDERDLRPFIAGPETNYTENMYNGFPAQIVELFPDQPERADVDCAGARQSINLALLVGPGLAVGDWVLVNFGFAVATMTAADARASTALLESLARSVDEEFVRDLARNGT